MYQPPHHREDRLEVQHALIRAHPLGTLITFGAGRLEANLIPFLLDSSRGANGVLQGHLARANGQWRELRSRDRGAGRLPGAGGLHHALLVCDQGRHRQGRADVELRSRPGARAAPHHRGARLAARPDRGADALAGRSARPSVGGRRCAGSLRRSPDEGHRRDRDADRSDRRQSGRSARTAPRPIAAVWSRASPLQAMRRARRWRNWCATGVSHLASAGVYLCMIVARPSRLDRFAVEHLRMKRWVICMTANCASHPPLHPEERSSGSRLEGRAALLQGPPTRSRAWLKAALRAPFFAPE